MDFKIEKESVPAVETVYEGSQEQSAELDYVLPDYYPDIFRLIRCRITPVVVESSISGGRLNYELRCDARILYCGEDGIVRCVEQSRSFQKSAELGGDVASPEYTLSPKTDYVNFRAASKRRLEVRGAVSTRIKVTGEKPQEAVTDASGMNIQLKKTPVRFASGRIAIDKTAQLCEEFELSAAQPPALCVAASRCIVSECEKKTAAGKLLVKGEAEIELLYSCEKDGEGAVEPASFSIPFSQIIDVDDEAGDYEYSVFPEVVSCSATPSEGRDGENRVIKTEVELTLRCRGSRTSSAAIVTDAYSTVYPCELTTEELRAERAPETFVESFRCSAKLAEGEDVPDTVYAVWCEPKNFGVRLSDDGKSAVAAGMLTYSVFAKDASGGLTAQEKEEAFEENVPLDIAGDLSGADISAEVVAKEVSYSISPEGALVAKVGVEARITVSGGVAVEAVTDIRIDDSVKKERDGDYSIKLYFGGENEDLWDIAKRYSTDVSAIAEENELAGDRLESGGPLLIPIIS